ncbi:hypothetical protein C8F04DRAFT_1183210 [Mycena alexandri]|uniref:Uncharacterized protein n=1 Tax=Mycena alexandri TaxID=1745969 RepID=A0AAD6SWK0_9AGAR|nr:hypothetical protein C8F04DRAFT_1183210 [Mycena alexandri]
MSDPIAESDAIFARAWASAIKNKFQLTTGEEQILYLSPLTQRGISGGDLTYEQVTNYLTYRFGDGLLNTNDPSFLGGGVASYIDDLRAYFDNILTKNDRAPAVILRMAKARKASETAQTAYETALSKAMTQWSEQKKFGITDQPFWSWVSTGAPYLRAADKTRNSAQTELDSASQLYYGPQADVLATYRNSIRDAMTTDPDRNYPGRNQVGITADRDLVAQMEEVANGGNKPPAADISPYFIRVPEYSMAGYRSQMNDWMRLSTSGQRDQVITIDIKQGRETKWSDYGFKEIKGSGSVGLFPFFSISAGGGSSEEKQTLKTEGREDEISLSLAAVGFSLIPVTSGTWDVPNVKNLFPNLVAGAPEVLTSKHAKPISVLVGYDIALTARFGTKIKKEVHEMYERARTGGGNLRIFGYHVSGSAGGSYSDKVKTSFDDVKWDEASGTLTLTPVPNQVYPSVLGVLARRL